MVMLPAIPALTVRLSPPANPSIAPLRLMLAPFPRPSKLEARVDVLSTVIPFEPEPRVITSPEVRTIPPR